MSTREIIILPDNRLKLVSAPVAEMSRDVRRLVEDMFDTMYEAPGIGLAAIQIAVPTRVVTVDISRENEPRNPLAFINPRITWASEDLSVYQEGCLSIPEYYEEVERPARVRVAYRDLDFVEREMECDGLLATCIQHEIDHLNGVLFIDHLSKLKRDRVTKKFIKQARQREQGH